MLTICPQCGSMIASIAAESVTCPCGHRYEADEDTIFDPAGTK